MIRAVRALALALALPVALAACGEAEEASFQGYLEGEYRFIAAPAGGWLEAVPATEGATVAEGAPLFVLDSAREKAAAAEARARLAQAESELADLRTGARAEEIAALQAQIAEAEASLRLARLDLERQQKLAQTAATPQARLDEARAEVARTAARLDRIRAELATARLPARRDRIAAAEAAVEAARAALVQVEWQLGQRSVRSPIAARVDDVARRVGEWVPANGVVVSLLPADAVKAILFVPEAKRAALAPGTALALACSGCPADLTARVTRIASEAEFTPPVIYSEGTRAKLVFRVEAALTAGGTLSPGQPVSATIRP